MTEYQTFLIIKEWHDSKGKRLGERILARVWAKDQEEALTKWDALWSKTPEPGKVRE